MSADRKTSNGAPFCSWVKKLPEEPKVSVTLWPVSCSNRAAIAGSAACRSDAAATLMGCAAATAAKHARNRTASDGTLRTNCFIQRSCDAAQHDAGREVDFS